MAQRHSRESMVYSQSGETGARYLWPKTSLARATGSWPVELGDDRNLLRRDCRTFSQFLGSGKAGQDTVPSMFHPPNFHRENQDAADGG